MGWGGGRIRRGKMRNQSVKALSVSRPVFAIVNRDGLTGKVLASYQRACNLVTSDREIIALVGPDIGNGPLNIVIEEISVLEGLKVGVPVTSSNGQLILGDSLVILLDGAQLWRPEVNWECLTGQRRRLEEGLAALCDWLSQNASTHVMTWNRAFLARAWTGIEGLLEALQRGHRSGIAENAALLAGLGPGLTPACDDYLMGLMAGLRVWPSAYGLSPQEACRLILQATEGRTTLLSSAHLHSAAEGWLGQDWHQLLAELVGGEAIGIQRAAQRILSSGATSGAAALAGFLSPYLRSCRPDQRGSVGSSQSSAAQPMNPSSSSNLHQV